jgi:hypothetical protein
LLSYWPSQLGVISAVLILGGLIAQLFTKHGILLQLIGVGVFLVYYAYVTDQYPMGLGEGFYLGVISTVILVILYLTSLTKSQSEVNSLAQ